MAEPLLDLDLDLDLQPSVKKEDFITNPWLVESFDEFLYYCCPECSYKCRQHTEFNSHALVAHPLARDAMLSSEQYPPEQGDQIWLFFIAKWLF